MSCSFRVVFVWFYISPFFDILSLVLAKRLVVLCLLSDEQRAPPGLCFVTDRLCLQLPRLCDTAAFQCIVPQWSLFVGHYYDNRTKKVLPCIFWSYIYQGMSWAERAGRGGPGRCENCHGPAQARA